jgi:hypothetical protein
MIRDWNWLNPQQEDILNGRGKRERRRKEVGVRRKEEEVRGRRSDSGQHTWDVHTEGRARGGRGGGESREKERQRQNGRKEVKKSRL